MTSYKRKLVLLGLKKYTEHEEDEDRSQGQIIWKKNRNKESDHSFSFLIFGHMLHTELDAHGVVCTVAYIQMCFCSRLDYF